MVSLKVLKTTVILWGADVLNCSRRMELSIQAWVPMMLFSAHSHCCSFHLPAFREFL